MTGAGSPLGQSAPTPLLSKVLDSPLCLSKNICKCATEFKEYPRTETNKKYATVQIIN